MSFSQLENFLERHIEGFFSRKFTSNLQFAEIQKKVKHIIAKEQRQEHDRIWVPNYYIIKMGTEDYDRIFSRKAHEMLYEYIVKTVMRENFFIRGKLQIAFQKDAELKRGNCQIETAFADLDEILALEKEFSEHTIIMRRPSLEENSNAPLKHSFARLFVSRGTDKNISCLLGEEQVHIGRREENEFLLTDFNASRLHAYISFEHYRHFLYDAKSLNGTFVNGKNVDCLCLKDGDCIDIGKSALVYEVLE